MLLNGVGKNERFRRGAGEAEVPHPKAQPEGNMELEQQPSSFEGEGVFVHDECR